MDDGTRPGERSGPGPVADWFNPDPTRVADAVAASLSNGETARNLPSDLPRDGSTPEAALSLVAPYVRGGARRLGDPGFLAHMDPPTPWVTWVAALLAASTNQNLLHPDTAPAARELESVVMNWLSPIFGMGGGHLVPGSTVANLTALWAARDLTGATAVAASSDSHLSVRKAAAILGMTYHPIDVSGPGANTSRALRAGDLARLFESTPDGPDPDSTIVVLTAGTTGTGAIDQLDLSNLTRPAWVHVDAAWAGPLRFSTRHRSRLDGLEQADSVAVSAHKWLYQPKESAMVLFADVAAANEAISVDGAYLAVPNVGLLGSHGAGAASLAATLLLLGSRGVGELVDQGMDTAAHLLQLIEADERLEAFGPNLSGVVAWRHREVDNARLQEALVREHDPQDHRPQYHRTQQHRERDGAFVSTVRIEGTTWLRSVAANPMADPQRVVDAVLSTAATLDRAGP